MSVFGVVPVDDSRFLVPEAVDLFLVAIADERLFIVADGGVGSRDIVSIE